MWQGWLGGELGFRKPVALKLLKNAREITPSLMNEARIGARLRHPNVIDVYELGRENGTWFLAMELVDGETVEALLAAHPDGLPPELAVSIVRQVAAGLAYAHGLDDESGAPLGLVHRDLKPANLMWTTAGVVKILDFGIAVFRDATRVTSPGKVLGTPHYLAPEQLRGQEADASADLWALGAIAVALATGRPLIDGGTQPKQLLAQLTAVDGVAEARRVAERVPALEAVVEGCLRQDPRRRWTAAEVVSSSTVGDALVATSRPRLTSGSDDTDGGFATTDIPTTGELDPPTAPLPQPSLSLPTPRRWPAVALAALLGSAALAVGAWWWWPQPGRTVVVLVPRERGMLDAFQRTRTLANEALTLVFEPLVRVGSDGLPQVSTIGRWEAEDSDRRWRLELRPDLVFHPSACTGEAPTPATAEDLRWSLEAGRALGELPFVSAERVGDEVLVSLDAPDPFFLQRLQSFPLLPAAMEGCDDLRDLAWPSGTGPYRFAAAPEGESLTLDRHRSWTPPPGVEPVRAERMVFRVSRSDQETLDQVASGRAEAGALANDQLLTAEGRALREPRPGLAVASSLPDDHVALKGLLVARRSPNPLTDAGARRALSERIDRRWLQETGSEALLPTDRFLVSDWLGYDPLLSHPAGDLPALVAHGPLTLGAFDSERALADRIAGALREAGVALQVVPLSRSHLEQLATGRSPVDLLLVELHTNTWGGVDPWPYLAELTSQLEHVSFVEPALKEAMVAAAVRDRRERADRYRIVDRELSTSMPFVPLGWLLGETTHHRLVYRAELRGLADPATGLLTADDPWHALALTRP